MCSILRHKLDKNAPRNCLKIDVLAQSTSRHAFGVCLGSFHRLIGWGFVSSVKMLFWSVLTNSSELVRSCGDGVT